MLFSNEILLIPRRGGPFSFHQIVMTSLDSSAYRGSHSHIHTSFIHRYHVV